MDEPAEHEGNTRSNNNDECGQIFKDDDTAEDTIENNNRKDIYSDPQFIQLEADLELARTDLKLMAAYMESKDKAFCNYYKDIPLSHESLVSFIEKENQKEELLEKETTSKEPYEQNTVVEQHEDGFTTVIGKQTKRNRNKKDNKKTTPGGSMFSFNRFLMGNEETSSDDSSSSDTTDKDGGELDFHKAKA